MFSRFVRLVLHLFVKPVRYGALKLMKKMRAPDDVRPIISVAEHLLDEFILPSTFRTFQEVIFRELARFKKLPVAEHDRIFNELQVAGVCIAIFHLRTAKSLTRPEDYHFWQGVEEYLPKQLQRMLMGYGVEGGNAKLMRQLIDMRRAEYEELARGMRDASEKSEGNPRISPPELTYLASVVHATAVGAVDHIRRGRLEEGDPLIRHLSEWLVRLQQRVGKFVKYL
ncbi:MAG: hypothetical protein HYY10_01115 [Candidatus Liptonbacteria bacterium]|nr:hypothetical protein [Candidatus Liptonbacteria bacterium]